MNYTSDPAGTPMDSQAQSTNTKEHVERICREIIAPLVKVDGGEIHLLRFEGEEVHIHLSGACAGCPGASLTGDRIILPALRAASPKVRIVLTTGVSVPEGAIAL
ncbi:MAG: NifU family protein [Polyangiaceae bacterium]